MGARGDLRHQYQHLSAAIASTAWPGFLLWGLQGGITSHPKSNSNLLITEQLAIADVSRSHNHTFWIMIWIMISGFNEVRQLIWGQEQQEPGAVQLCKWQA